MFINCPHCGALVATDPATDQPPPRCPRCAAGLRDDDSRAGGAGDGASAASDPPAPTPALPIVPLRTPSADDAPVTAPAPPQAATNAPAEPAVAADGAPAAPTDAGANVVAAPSSVADASARGTAGGAGDGGPAPPPAAADPSTRAAATMRPGVHAPSFARTRRATARAVPASQRWLLPALVLALSLALAMQWLLADRHRLAADARWRPLVVQACAVLRCDVPAWREPAALSLLDRDVRPHPRQPGVLRVNATFRNDARWAQAWPRVLLTLSDIDGRVVAARHFAAAEYLGAPPSRAALAPGQSASIRMDVVEPSPGIVAFAFAFE